MESVKSEKLSTPYAYQKYIDEQKHLDTDELRHTMKPICHVVVQDLKGEEHKFCDKEQLCPLGKFRRPKKMMEAESKGFASVADMMEAEKKAVEDAKQKEMDDLRQYKTLSDERFEKMGRLIADQNKMMEFLMGKLK
jgi:2-methylcitrate dehydratase PrpD